MVQLWYCYKQYRPFQCKLSPRSESIKNRCYAHYHLYRLHPLVGKHYRRPIAVTQIQADLRCQQNSATAKKKTPLIGLPGQGNSLDGSFLL